MTKKDSSLKVTNKGPLTVFSSFRSIITKIINKRMNKICERENLYGDTQCGFRVNRSTSDCIFILLTVVKKAFCDLKKAYDAVNREIMYKILEKVGFGEKCLSIVQSMYFNDCVQINLGGRLSAPLWFTQGVKQGCNLSPVLFALYIARLVVRLQETVLGVELGDNVITCLLFADDLILISRTSN